MPDPHPPGRLPAGPERDVLGALQGLAREHGDERYWTTAQVQEALHHPTRAYVRRFLIRVAQMGFVDSRTLDTTGPSGRSTYNRQWRINERGRAVL